jgi:hypothetical protein
VLLPILAFLAARWNEEPFACANAKEMIASGFHFDGRPPRLRGLRPGMVQPPFIEAAFTIAMIPARIGPGRPGPGGRDGGQCWPTPVRETASGQGTH